MINFGIFLVLILMVMALQGCNWGEEKVRSSPQQQEEMTPADEQLLLDEQMKREEDTREVNSVPEGDS